MSSDESSSSSAFSYSEFRAKAALATNSNAHSEADKEESSEGKDADAAAAVLVELTSDNDSDDEDEKEKEAGAKLDDRRELNGEGNRQKGRSNHKKFDSEYYSLPPIENLTISVKEDDRLEKFGTVDSHIDFIVKIRPLAGVPHLGYETVLFDIERRPLGEIFEIFGTVTETLYAVRFNSSGEAAEKMPIGKEVYYVATNETVTKTVFPEELAKLKNWERFRSNPDEASSEEELFSDDAEEQQHLAKKRQKSRHRHNSSQSGQSSNTDASTAPTRKKLRKRRSEDPRINPFHPQHNQWRQQRQFPAGGHPQQQFMPPNPYQYMPGSPYYAQYQANAAGLSPFHPQWSYYNPMPPNVTQFAHPSSQQPYYPPPTSTQHHHQFFNAQAYIPQRPYRPFPPR